MTLSGRAALVLGMAMLVSQAAAQAPPTTADLSERLARLEEGQRSLEKRLDDFRAEMNRHFGDIDRRFEDLQAGVNQRFDSVTQRFEGIDRRFDELRNFMLWGFGVTFSGIFALIGFVLWDRRTALAPAVRRAEELHEREQRLEAALRDYAARAPDLAESLRKAGIL
jgi:hypothetical protein